MLVMVAPSCRLVVDRGAVAADLSRPASVSDLWYGRHGADNTSCSSPEGRVGRPANYNLADGLQTDLEGVRLFGVIDCCFCILEVLSTFQHFLAIGTNSLSMIPECWSQNPETQGYTKHWTAYPKLKTK